MNKTQIVIDCDNNKIEVIKGQGLPGDVDYPLRDTKSSLMAALVFPELKRLMGFSV